jgi:hypothetical protein
VSGVAECDHCGQVLEVDENGWWVGNDRTSDCPAHSLGHEVNGEARP